MEDIYSAFQSLHKLYQQHTKVFVGIMKSFLYFLALDLHSWVVWNYVSNELEIMSQMSWKKVHFMRSIYGCRCQHVQSEHRGVYWIFFCKADEEITIHTTRRRSQQNCKHLLFKLKPEIVQSGIKIQLSVNFTTGSHPSSTPTDKQTVWHPQKTLDHWSATTAFFVFFVFSFVFSTTASSLSPADKPGTHLLHPRHPTIRLTLEPSDASTV